MGSICSRCGFYESLFHDCDGNIEKSKDSSACGDCKSYPCECNNLKTFSKQYNEDHPRIYCAVEMENVLAENRKLEQENKALKERCKALESVLKEVLEDDCGMVGGVNEWIEAKLKELRGSSEAN